MTSASKLEMTQHTRKTSAWVAWCLFLAIVSSAGQVSAQSWEFSPYRIQVWYGGLEVLDEYGLDPADFEQLLRQQARVVAGATWSLEFGEVPISLRPDLTNAIDRVSAEFVAAIVDPPPKDDELATADIIDKVFLLGLTQVRNRHQWSVREFDVRTRTWSDVIEVPVAGRASIAGGAFSGMAEAFRPLLRIESSEGKVAKGRIRAGGLVVNAYTPAAVLEGAVVQPVIRTNDRTGRVLENGIEVVEWTLGVVEESKSNLVPIKLHSAFGNPFGVRQSKRKKKLALVERKRYPATKLFLKSRDEAQVPMAGYEIYAKDPITSAQKLLGITDWRGAIDITPQQDMPLFLVLYVRNGGQLLSRLPIQIGAHEELVGNVRDDNRRLQAEAFVEAIQGNILELVAARELAAARARAFIKEKKFDEAQQQVANMRRLTSPDELRDRLNAEEGRIWKGVDRKDSRTVAKFTKTLNMIAKFLPSDMPEVIASEVETAMGK
jgi:hypothetical protein